MNKDLPIAEALPALKAALNERTEAVLVAPPGAGKTTVVPLALLDEPWVRGRKLIVLEPRRLAARAAAERMAMSLSEPVGRTVGYRVRLASRVSATTRVEVVTEGVFTRMVLDDPGLEGVAGVLFDEFHERSLDADLGLAFARDAQSLLREDLRLLVMSATLDGAEVAGKLGGAPVIESLGRAFPVETTYLGRDPVLTIEAQVERAVRRALVETEGGVLAFLPGVAEIRRTEAQLAERLSCRDDVILAPLYGALGPAEQDRAIAPAPASRRKVVLATSIAETSLTLEGVRVVVDSGLARVPRFDPASGLTRLATVRASRAAVDQRRGRAGRISPGVCYRLWNEAENRALPPFGRPEMLESDLSGVALALAQWGTKNPNALLFLDPPPAAAYAEARALLERLGALDERGDLTAHGRRLTLLPLAPRLAHMVLAGAEHGAGARAAKIAALLSESGLGGTDVDLGRRLERFARDAGRRARDVRALAKRWATLAGGAMGEAGPSDGRILVEAYPERIARAKGAPGRYQLVNGRGAQLDPTDPLAREPWLAVGELGGGADRDHIRLAAPLTESEAREAFAGRIVTENEVEVDEVGKARARRVERLGAIVLGDHLMDGLDLGGLAAALLAHVRAKGLALLPWSEEAVSLRCRTAFLRRFEPDSWPDLSDATLLAELETWLKPLLAGRSAIAEIGARELVAALRTQLPRDLQRRLDREASERFLAPTGSSIPIDYGAEGGPRAEVRVQELFGLATHPMLAGGRARLVLALLSPARRPVQVTADLPAFWAGSWKAVRAEMRGRYPKHPWPEDPLAAAPTTRAKPKTR